MMVCLESRRLATRVIAQSLRIDDPAEPEHAYWPLAEREANHSRVVKPLNIWQSLLEEQA
jgi:hypothetical protein